MGTFTSGPIGTAHNGKASIMTTHFTGHTLLPLAAAIGWIAIATLIVFSVAAIIMTVTRR